MSIGSIANTIFTGGHESILFVGSSQPIKFIHGFNCK